MNERRDPIQTVRTAGPLLVTTSTLPVSGGDGVPRFVLDLAKALDRSIETIVLAPHAPGSARAENMDGLSVRRFRYFWPDRLQRLTAGGVVAVNLGSGWSFLLVPFLFVAGILATARSVRRFGCVAVNAHWMIPMGFCAAVASVLTGVPLVLHVHAGDVYFLKRVPLGGVLARFVVGRSSFVFASGSHVRDSLDTLIGRPSNAVLRPMGVWVENFRGQKETSKRQPNSIVFVGRLVEKKGVSVLLEAVARLVEDLPEVKLDIIGSGPLDVELRGQADRLGLDDVVTFHGSLPHSEVITHLHRSVVSCVPSIIDRNGETEGMPTVVIEAMASGLRVVGSDVDGIPDVLRDGLNGWLATPNDSQDLASKLRVALTEDNEIITDRAQSEAEKYDWPEVAEEYSAVIRRVSKSRSHRKD